MIKINATFYKTDEMHGTVFTGILIVGLYNSQTMAINLRLSLTN